jgi:hypothetical protein
VTKFYNPILEKLEKLNYFNPDDRTEDKENIYYLKNSNNKGGEINNDPEDLNILKLHECIL